MASRSNINLVGNTTLGQNVGTGEGVYKDKLGSNLLQFKTISATGNSIQIFSTADRILISGSTGSGNTATKFTSDILVSIAAGKTFGKYVNGETIPALGKTSNEVIIMALAESLAPTVSLGSSGNDVSFGQASKTVSLNFSYIINTVGANVASVLLEYNRGAGWVSLSTNTGATTYLHNINDSGNRFNVTAIQYKYTVTDSAGATGQTSHTVTPQAYTIPTYSPTYVGSIVSYETQSIRESGNIDTTIAGSISSNRSLVNITGYTIQRCVDGGGYSTVATCTGLSSLTPSITSCLDSGAAATATSIGYRIQVGDEYTNNNSSTYTITLRFASYYGYSPNSLLSSAQIVALGNQALLTSRARTMTLTAGGSDYTYVSYPASFGDLTNAIMDGASPVLGSFNKLIDVSVLNGYGQSVSNIIYKSNATGAFTSNSVAFS